MTTDRFFTAENVLDLARIVFPLRVLKNKDGDHICQLQFLVPGQKGFQLLSSKLKDVDKEYDHYDGMYCLMHQAAEIIKKGMNGVENLVVADENANPITMLEEMTKPK